jgi:ribosome maturation factor RimP
VFVAEKGLDGWVGRRVTVQLAEEESHRFSCTLESVDDRGIIVSYQRREDPGTHRRFYPWHSVRYIHLADAAQSVG